MSDPLINDGGINDGGIGERIRAAGSVSVERFMQMCAARYLRRRDSIGRGGDFITAPEMTQVFGEILAMWSVWVWREMGEPSPFDLIELGPGRGTLMADILGCALDGFRRGSRLHLVERSPALIALQKAALERYDPIWHESFEAVDGDGPCLIIANEFFDALPIRQFVRVGRQWRERMVGWDDDRGTLRFITTDDPGRRVPRGALPKPRHRPKDGDILEIGPRRDRLIARIAEALIRRGGAALIIDYGYRRSEGRDTLDAVSAHRRVPALERPGRVDLSADVDFHSLRAHAARFPVTVWPAIDMGEFLLSLGLRQRTRRLAAAASTDRGRRLYSAAARLVSSMGSRFQVMALSSPGLRRLPGWDDG